jgi:hypothetical protein
LVLPTDGVIADGAALTVEEYNQSWQAILNALGGSLAAPAVWADKGNYHYCSGRLKIYVPHPEKLTSEERATIIRIAREHYLKDKSG